MAGGMGITVTDCCENLKIVTTTFYFFEKGKPFKNYE